MKKRVLEFLAVRKLRRDMKGPILCLQGPPGVGKTSLGKSVARAMGRKFQRIALGGVRDEAELRGHRRTYIGAMPGVIIQALAAAQSNNPVILLDEIDKLSRDHASNPQGCLLEILDGEQNGSFKDHYINTPFDLGSIFFLATSNDLMTIDRPLRDRMEILELSGYSIEEKVFIALKHLLPKQRKLHALEIDGAGEDGDGMKKSGTGPAPAGGVNSGNGGITATGNGGNGNGGMTNYTSGGSLSSSCPPPQRAQLSLSGLSLSGDDNSNLHLKRSSPSSPSPSSSPYPYLFNPTPISDPNSTGGFGGLDFGTEFGTKDGFGTNGCRLEITREGLLKLITQYTAESGVRSLERRIAEICRWVAYDIVVKEGKTALISRGNMSEKSDTTGNEHGPLSQNPQEADSDGTTSTTASSEGEKTIKSIGTKTEKTNRGKKQNWKSPVSIHINSAEHDDVGPVEIIPTTDQENLKPKSPHSSSLKSQAAAAAAALAIVPPKKVYVIGPEEVRKICGLENNRTDSNLLSSGMTVPGVAIGLAVTFYGGELLLVESAKSSPGSGQLTITGQLGDVMKESVRASLSLLKPLIKSREDVAGGGDKADVHV